MKHAVFVGLLVLTMAVSLQVALVKRPSNYRVATTAARNILEGENPYAPQPRLDFFKYSPLAGLLMAPFSAVPETVGMFVLSFLQFWLFFWAFRRWARTAGVDPLESAGLAAVAVVSTILDATASIQNCQINAAIFALMLLGAALYAEGEHVFSGLVVSLATDLKLFPFTLGLCLLTDLNRRYWVGFWAGLLLWLWLPSVVVGLEANHRLLAQWVALMRWDQTRRMPMLDIGTFCEMHFGIDRSVRDPLAVLIGLLLGLTTFYLFRKGWRDLLNRFLLPINGVYVLIFSYLSESPTSVLATAGMYLVGAQAVRERKHAWRDWTLWAISLALVPASYSDLVPRGWSQWGRSFHLKTVGYLFLAAVTVYMGLRHYSKTPDPEPSTAPSIEPIEPSNHRSLTS